MVSTFRSASAGMLSPPATPTFSAMIRLTKSSVSASEHLGTSGSMSEQPAETPTANTSSTEPTVFMHNP